MIAYELEATFIDDTVFFYHKNNFVASAKQGMDVPPYWDSRVNLSNAHAAMWVIDMVHPPRHWGPVGETFVIAGKLEDMFAYMCDEFRVAPREVLIKLGDGE